MPSKAKPKAAKRPSRLVKGKPTAAKPQGAAGKGKRSTATKDPLVAAKPALLAGGNPQIAKADGDAPVQAEQKECRSVDSHEDDQLDEELVARSIRQASELPGWVP